MSKTYLDYEGLSEVIKRILSSFKAYAVILFGSRARGDYKPWSDYDILIIADFRERYLDRIGNILELVSNININVEPHPYTLNEAIEMLKKGNPIIVDALSEGIILYSREEFKELLKLYEELLRKGLKKSETSVIVPP
ncbi:MAG: nucleotidyltransferase domain-containing protein, partial [Desulfurococcaceae archaeon]